MAAIKIIKRRIRSAKNIKQITKAMEMVAASKMRRAQEKALTTRPYSTKLREILSQLATRIRSDKHPMLRSFPDSIGATGIILISSDRGLCGALNTNLFRAMEEFKLALHEEMREQMLSFEYIAVGRKSRDYVLKTGQALYAEFTNLPERPKFEDVSPIAKLAIEGFMSGKFKQVYIVYTDFVTTLKQEVNSFRLLPIETKKLKEPAETLIRPMKDYLFEPDADTVMEALLPHYIEMQVYQTALEALASEQSARMVAMKSASDNAAEIIQDLTLIYNKDRQQSITSEIADLVTSRKALSA